MMIDPSAVLALLSTLTQQVAALQAENAQLREARERTPCGECSHPNGHHVGCSLIGAG